MAPSFKPKRFPPVFVFYDGNGGTRFSTSPDGEKQSHPPNDKPVLTLLASVAQCLLESLRIIARQTDTQLPEFHVSVSGEKAVDLPGRLQSITCVVSGNLADDPQDAERMVAEAKRICTVSNTLNCKIEVSYARA